MTHWFLVHWVSLCRRLASSTRSGRFHELRRDSYREADGGVHVHVLAARCDLETGQSLNIASPGWE